jgi:NAD(P)H-flavin reductase
LRYNRSGYHDEVRIITYKKYNIPTVASLNTIMVDGTGMCGACRVSIGGKTKFVCVDGPDLMPIR